MVFQIDVVTLSGALFTMTLLPISREIEYLKGMCHSYAFQTYVFIWLLCLNMRRKAYQRRKAA